MTQLPISTLPLATMLGISITLLLVLLVICSVFLVFLVLLQRPKDQGLGTTFGGEMAEQLLGGTGAADVLQKGTIWFGSAFFALAFLISILYARETSLARKGTLIQGAISAPTTPGAAAGATVEPPPAETSATSPAVETSATPLPETSATPAPEVSAVPAPAPETSATPAPATDATPAASPFPVTPGAESSATPAPAPETSATPAPETSATSPAQP